MLRATWPDSAHADDVERHMVRVQQELNRCRTRLMVVLFSYPGTVFATVCAAAAFVSHARPGIGGTGRWVGLGEQLDRSLVRRDEKRLMAMILGARWPLTGLVFGSAFVAGDHGLGLAERRRNFALQIPSRTSNWWGVPAG